MMNVTFLAANTLSWGEAASRAGIVTLVGVSVIFLVLAILWGAIEIMHALLQKDKKKTSEASAPAVGVPNPEDAAVAAAIAAAIAASEDDGAIVAAITAAIIAARAEEGDTTPFRVVSFQRRPAARTRRF